MTTRAELLELETAAEELGDLWPAWVELLYAAAPFVEGGPLTHRRKRLRDAYYVAAALMDEIVKEAANGAQA
jgi:hypothetical protein